MTSKALSLCRPARDYLGDLVGTKEVTCTTRMGELGAAMVTGGYSPAFVPCSARYVAQEHAATSARRNVHGHKCHRALAMAARQGVTGSYPPSF